MKYTNQQIKIIAEYALANSEWFDERQKQDTEIGFRIGFLNAINQSDYLKNEWEFCPECGCEEYDEESIFFAEKNCRQCSNCGQDWYTHINYSHILKSVIRKKYEEIKRLNLIIKTQISVKP